MIVSIEARSMVVFRLVCQSIRQPLEGLSVRCGGCSVKKRWDSDSVKLRIICHNCIRSFAIDRKEDDRMVFTFTSNDRTQLWIMIVTGIKLNRWLCSSNTQPTDRRPLLVYVTDNVTKLLCLQLALVNRRKVIPFKHSHVLLLLSARNQLCCEQLFN